MEIDRTRGYVNQLSQALEKLTAAVNTASDASSRHARSLVFATWALVFVTVVLVVVTAIGAYATKGVLMRRLVAIALALLPLPSFGESYTLIFESKCSSTGERLEFSCKREPAFSGPELSIFRKGESWYGKEILKTLEGKEHVFPLQLNKQDASVMVFNYPVLYSGIATIVLIKKTGRYYFSEISYSEALRVQDATIEAGSFILGK